MYKPSQYNIWFNVKDTTFLYNTLTTGLLSVDNDTAKRTKSIFNGDSSIMSLSNDEQKILLRNGFIVPVETDELDIIRFRRNCGAYSETNYSITIVPTTKCNFICSYCFEKDKKPEVMTEEDCNEILKYLDHEFTQIQIKTFTTMWYGGEPLLAMNVIEYFMPELKKLCDKHAIKLKGAGITTNGYLLDESTAKRLVSNEIHWVQISLDGDRDDHNKTRILPDGTGSFDRVHDAIEISKRFFKSTSVRFNANWENIEKIKKMLVDDPVFKGEKIDVYAASLKLYLGGAVERCKEKVCFTSQELQKIQAEISGIMHGDKEITKDHINRFPKKRNYCGGDSARSFIFGPGRHVYKCSMCLDPVDRVGILNEGKFIPNANFWKWVMDEPYNNKACSKCVFLPMCMGGCPVIRRNLALPNEEVCGYWKSWLKQKFVLYEEYLNKQTVGCAS